MVPSQQQTYSQGILLVLIATVGWSLSGLFVRFMPELNGWQINGWRGLWTGMGLLCYLVIAYGENTLAVFKRIPFIALLTSAGFFALGSTMYVTSLTLVSTAVVSVIGATAPLFTGLLSPWVTGEKPSAAAWFAAVLALLGVSIIAWDGVASGNLIGLLVCLMVPISFAVQTLVLRRYRDIDMVPAICLGGFLAFVVCGAIGTFLGIGLAQGVPLSSVGLLLVMGVVQLAIPLIFYARGAKSVPAITLSLIVMLDAVLNPLWPWLVVGETPERSSFIGGAVIIVAVLVSIFGSTLLKRSSKA